MLSSAMGCREVRSVEEREPEIEFDTRVYSPIATVPHSHVKDDIVVQGGD